MNELQVGQTVYLDMPNNAQRGMPGRILDKKYCTSGNKFDYRVQFDNGSDFWLPVEWLSTEKL